MKKTTINDLPVMDNPLGLEARFVADGPTARLMHIRLGPGDKVPSHPSPIVIDFVVLHGAGRALEGEAQVSVSRGDVVRFEANVVHGFVAGDGGLELLGVKHG